MTAPVRYRPLGRTGLDVSALSLGAAPLGGAYQPIDQSSADQLIRSALDLGVNLIDVAPYYGLGRAETVLGQALRGIARDRYLLATKIGRYGLDDFDFSADRVKTSLDTSCGRLGTDQIDLVICHDVEFGDLDLIVSETIPAMRLAVDRGQARFVGISGLPLDALQYVVERAPLDFVLSYCHHTLLDQTLLARLGDWKSRGLGVINASPLAMGLLTPQGPPSWHPAPEAMKTACREASQLCESRGVDLASLAIQYSLQTEAIDCTLVGASTPEELRRNVEWIDTPINESTLADVLHIFNPVRDQSWPSGRFGAPG